MSKVPTGTMMTDSDHGAAASASEYLRHTLEAIETTVTVVASESETDSDVASPVMIQAFTIETLSAVFTAMAAIQQSQSPSTGVANITAVKESHHRMNIADKAKASAQVRETIKNILTRVFNSSCSNLLCGQLWLSVLSPQPHPVPTPASSSLRHVPVPVPVPSLLPSTPSYKRQCIQLLFSAFRVIHNFFGTDMDWFVSFTGFNIQLMQGVPCALLAEYLALYNHFSVDAKQALFHRMSIEPAFCNSVATEVSAEDALDVCSDWLRHVSSTKQLSHMVDTTAATTCITALVKKAISCNTGADETLQPVLIELLMKRPHPPYYCKAVIEGFPCGGSAMVGAIDMIAALWGHSSTIARGDQVMQDHLTNVLLLLLHKVTADDLSDDSSDPNRIPIMYTLSTGVSKYLDMADTASRRRGMVIASKYSCILGQEIKFEELGNAFDPSKDIFFEGLSLSPVTERQPVVEKASNIGTGANILQKSNKRPESCRGTTVLYESSSDSDGHNDSDSDSELEAFEINEPSALPKSATYLRHCLELLQCSETKAEAYDSYRSAMTSIPAIVSSNPLDARDVSAALTRDLICLANCFQMEDFDQLKSAGLKALLTAYPEWTVPITMALIESTDSLSLGSRLSIITELTNAMGILAGFDLSKNTNQDSAMELHASTKASAKETHPNGDNQSTKTFIRRPAMLALHGKKTRYFRNKFANIAPLLYFPMLRVLVKSMPTATGISTAEFNHGGFRLQQQVANADTSGLADGVEYLLPAKAFKAIAEFTRYSLNTTFQRTCLESTLKIAATHRESPSLEIRRVAVEALMICMESYFHQKQRSSAAYEHIALDAGRPLAQLMNITGAGLLLNDGLSSGSSSAGIDSIDEAAVATIDWAAATLKSDPCDFCRAMKLEIIRLGVDGFENTSHSMGTRSRNKLR